MIPATAFTLLFALWCARDDAQQISRHSKIYHGIQWTFRSAVVVAVCCLTATWWLALGMAGLFSAVFRWDLNGRRGKDWRYVSPSNWYDYAWLFITWFGHLSRPMSIRDAYVFHHGYYRRMGRHDQYQPAVHRAGTMAYIFEALLFVGVVVLYLQGVMDDPPLARWTWTKW